MIGQPLDQQEVNIHDMVTCRRDHAVTMTLTLQAWLPMCVGGHYACNQL